MALVPGPLAAGRELLKAARPVRLTESRGPELHRRFLGLHEALAAISSSRDFDQLHRALEAAFGAWLPHEAVRLAIADGTSYRRVRISGPNPHGSGIFPGSHGVIGTVLANGEPLLIPDALEARGLVRGLTEVLLESFPRSLIVVPLTAAGRVFGALEILSSQVNRFDDLDYRSAQLLATTYALSRDAIAARQELASIQSRVHEHERSMLALNEQLQQLAHTDDLTGLHNKRRLIEQLDSEVALAKRYGDVLSCLMIDLDEFKQINDTLGHPAGDEVLRQVGIVLRRSVRITDFVARYGGEEFTVLLPRTGRSGARKVAETLHANIGSHRFLVAGRELHVTVSIGIASFCNLDRFDTAHAILQADTALYRAKRSGRDRVCDFEAAQA